MDNIAHYVTEAEVAKAAGLQLRSVKNALRRAYLNSDLWHGKDLDVSVGENGLIVSFTSLPDHIRECFLMQDQMELPFQPPRWTVKNENTPPLH